MSRGISVAILALLVGCLAVMSYVIRPHNPNEPDPDIEKKQREVQARNAQEVSDRTHMQMAKAQKARVATADAKKDPGASALPSKMPKPPPSLPRRTPGQMNITADWYRTRPDGTKGLEVLQKEQEQLKKEMELAKKSGVVAQPSTPRQSHAHVKE